MENLETQAAEAFKNIQFSQKFVEAVVCKTKEKLAESRTKVVSQKTGLMNQKMSLEQQRNRLEDAVIDGLIDRDI